MLHFITPTIPIIRFIIVPWSSMCDFIIAPIHIPRSWTRSWNSMASWSWRLGCFECFPLGSTGNQPMLRTSKVVPDGPAASAGVRPMRPGGLDGAQMLRWVPIPNGGCLGGGRLGDVVVAMDGQSHTQMAESCIPFSVILGQSKATIRRVYKVMQFKSHTWAGFWLFVML